MAGHSKWANIKHRKAAADAKKGKVFTRLIKEITVAAKLGGADANANPRLRLAMDKAREANMTKDSVQNAIKRGAGQLDGVSYEEARYEGYGPAGAAGLGECPPHNPTRTGAEGRPAFTQNGGNLGSAGSGGFFFLQVGPFLFPPGPDHEARDRGATRRRRRRAHAPAPRRAREPRRRAKRLHDGGGRLRILGIDPGLQITGFGVIEKDSRGLRYITSGCVKSGAGDLAARLKVLLEGLREVIAQHVPVEVAVEKVFVNINPQSTLALGQPRGAPICAAGMAGLPVAEYTALQVKQSVVGHGQEAKTQVQHMVRRLLAPPGGPSPRAAGAPARALLHPPRPPPRSLPARRPRLRP